MKTYAKILIGFITIGLLLVSPQAGFAQHSVNLPPGDSIKISQKVKKSILSFNVLSALNKQLYFGYDQLIGTRTVFSAQFGITGIGYFEEAHPYRGAFLGLGPKLFFSPVWKTDGLNRIKAMQGWYFKPEAIVALFPEPFAFDFGYGPIKSNPISMSLLLNFGKQWIFSNSFSLDVHMGAGYSLPSRKLIISLGVNLGVPF